MADIEYKSSKPLTIADIAEALGVSKTTVSRAISGKGRIGGETKARVHRYITEHHYTPSAIAKALANSKTYNVSVVLPGECSMVALPFYQSCLNGVVGSASSLEYDVLVTPVFNDDISQLKRAVANHKVDGVIITIENEKVINYLKEMQVPFVALDMADEEVVRIGSDHFTGAKELTSFLIEKGCRNIGLIGGNDKLKVNKERLNGFKEAFKCSGKPLDENLIYLNVDGVTKTEEVVMDLLDRKVDGIVCMNDSLCIYAINKIKAENVKIPEDIRIVSLYNSDLLDMVKPGITSLDFDTMEIGRVAFKVLYDMLEGRKISKRTLLGYNILFKDSTK